MAVYSGQADAEAEQRLSMSYKVQISKWTVIMNGRMACINIVFSTRLQIVI